MFLIIIAVLIAGWALMMGWRLYRATDWNEPPDPSPDLKAMHKRQAELMHIQEVLEEARREGKLSQTVLDEFSRFSESEIEALRQVETTWKNRHKKI